MKTPGASVIELIGAELDAAVAKAEGVAVVIAPKSGKCLLASNGTNRDGRGWYSPSGQWKDGGPIIQRERIELVTPHVGSDWYAHWWPPGPKQQKYRVVGSGPTPLIAAMRAYVASKG
jgi:hypothetical protein